MTAKSMTVYQGDAATQEPETATLLLGTGLVLASMILLPALAARVGLGPSLTGAMRIVLMKASNQIGRRPKGGNDLAANRT